MKPIKKGMTEAVTRDGRKVTQLTWFDVEEGDCIIGVVDGEIESWQESGMWNSNTNYQSNLDIFAPIEYEWQWLYCSEQTNGNLVYSTTGFFKSEGDAHAHLSKHLPKFISLGQRIEESKREAK